VADWSDFRPADLLGVLVAHGVDFVVVGGLAAVLHGSSRITQDLDVIYSPEPANLEILGQALLELDAKLYGIAEDVPFVPDARTLAQTEILTLATRLGKLDLLRRPSGAPPYGDLRSRARLIRTDDFGVRIAHADDLIAMKRAACRAKGSGRHRGAGGNRGGAPLALQPLRIMMLG